MVKFQFAILTQNGLKIDSIAIMGKDRADAERKLRQMYRYCEVQSCEVKPVISIGTAKPAQLPPAQEKAAAEKKQENSMEDILALISG